MTPEGFQPLQGWIQKLRDAAVGANIVGVFDCQGQVCQETKTRMLNHPMPQVRAAVQADSSRGQPDATRLERGRTFANEIMNGLKP
jgi:flavodoxin I